jgi:ring-1,2-phenylacetyl-CoA epoxidase subunit PaaC
VTVGGPPASPDSPLGSYAVRLGDDALVLAQRLAWWSSRAPELEEDLALTNIALDLLGQARTLLSSIGDEDELAFLRSDREFRNLLIVEQPNGDFAQTVARQLLFSTFQLARYEALIGHEDETINGVAGKAVKEVRYHLDHAVQWTVRLGDGTDESHARMQAALDRLWPYTHEMLAHDDFEAEVGVDPARLQEGWDAAITQTLEVAMLKIPADDGWRPAGGRRGQHSEGLSYLLAEMQSLHREHPGATW